MKMFTCKFAQDEVTHQRLRVGSKKSVQQGRSHFYARSVCVICGVAGGAMKSRARGGHSSATLIELTRFFLSLSDRGWFPPGYPVFCGGCRPGRRAPHCLSCFSLPAPMAPHDPWSGYRHPRFAGRSGRLLFGSVFSTRASFAVFSRVRAQREYAVERRHRHLRNRTVLVGS
jgi:hypothetical protein